MVLRAANSQFAEMGKSEDEIFGAMIDKRLGDLDWNNPRNMKAAYFAGDDVFRIAQEAYSRFHGDNLLYGRMLYPSLVQMSSDVVAAALELLNAPAEASGTFTSGGTESIILAVRAARNWARAERPTTGVPEILVGHTCHAAFNKAADMLGLTVVRLPSNEDHRVDAEVMRAHVSENTIMVVGSAPAYPMGGIDPITEISEIAEAYNLWMHVDACVGGFFLPFAAELEDIPAFDFSVRGVRSMSADLHKYGYTSRGASLLLLADRRYEEYQRFFFDDWPTGEFVTTTIAGSRPGGAVASAWAVVTYLGRAGYRERVSKIIEGRRALVHSVTQIDELRVIGKPQAGIVGIGANPGTDMRAVRQGMMDRGWKFAPIVDPVGMNMLLNFTHGEIIGELQSDLKASVTESKRLSPATIFEDDTYGG